jgi:hypothetical protein
MLVLLAEMSLRVKGIVREKLWEETPMAEAKDEEGGEEPGFYRGFTVTCRIGYAMV